MTSKIYLNVDKADIKMIGALIEDLSWFERETLIGNKPDVTKSPYYYLNYDLNYNYGLPSGFKLIECNSLEVVDIPKNLRQCIFENAPNLPANYKKIVEYWHNTESLIELGTNSWHFQNSENSYMVKVLDNIELGIPVTNDKLITDSVVVHLKNVLKFVNISKDDFLNLSDDVFICVDIPIDENVLNIENSDIEENYNLQSSNKVSIFLKCKDIIASPDPQNIYINLLRYDLKDYGYFY